MQAARTQGLAAALLLGLALCSSAAAESAASADSRGTIARQLFDEARQYAGVGDWKTALDCLGEAEKDSPANADILYLEALASVKLGAPLDSPLASLNAALAAGPSQLYGIWDLKILKAQLLLRERRFNEALDTLGNPDPIALADPAYAITRDRLLALKGDSAGFIQALSDSLRRFPDNTGFPKLFLRYAGPLALSDAAAKDLSIILSRLPDYAENDPELPVLAAPFMPTQDERTKAVLAFRAKAGHSASATLRALEYGIIDEPAAASEFFSGAYPLKLEDLRSLYDLAGSPAGREAIRAQLAAFSGTIHVDANNDDIDEASFVLSKALISSYEIDSRQSGTINEKLSFSDGLPVSADLVVDDTHISLQYQRYPHASVITFTDSQGSRLYRFSPEALSFSPIQLKPFAGEGKSQILLPYACDDPRPRESACLQTALSVETLHEGLRTVTVVNRGIPISAVTYDGSRVYSTTTFERGAPKLERVDMDGDGRFETERGFAQDANGQWQIAWIRVDEREDGIYEYREETLPPYTKQWDFEGKGRIDARQSTLPDGSLKTEYSSRLDGNLDELLITMHGKIIRLERNGKSIGLFRDQNPALQWLGTKKFDLGSNLPDKDGIYYFRNYRYRLTYVKDLAFAELVP